MSDMQYKVMVVDDEKKNHKILEEVFDGEYEIIAANSGKEALELLIDHSPDVVLLDIMMPDMDGFEVCKTIKSDKKWINLPIIFVSAKDTLDDRLQGYEMGAIDYFIKPFDHAELLVKVKHILEYKKQFDKTHDTAEEAGHIALQAMKNASELGVVLRFLHESYGFKDIPTLAKRLLEILNEFGLSCCVQFRYSEGNKTFNENGVASPLEETILMRAKDKGRIFDRNNFSIYNYETLSLIVKNMPIDDELRYGVIKDLVCYILDGAEARVRGLQSEMDLDKQKIYLLRLIGYAGNMVEKLNGDMHEVRKKGADVVEDMMERMEELIPRLGLEEDQEKILLEITQNGVSQTTKIFSEGIKVDEEFSIIMNKLQQVIGIDNISNHKLETILAGIL